MHGAGILLLASVAGYWVLERASYQRKSDVRHVGKFLGWLIIVVSIVGVACDVYSLAKCKTGYCPMPMGKNGYCPYTAHSSLAPAEAK